MITKIKKKSLS